MNAVIKYLRNRLQEPSTWRGILLLLTALGVSIRPDLWEGIVTLGIALAGIEIETTEIGGAIQCPLLKL